MHKYVEKLLNGRKVEWRRLGDVAIVYNGLSGKSKSDFKNGKAKFVPYKNIFNNLEIDVTELDKVKILENEQQNKVQYGDVLFTASSETLEEVGISSVVTSKNLNNIYLNSFSFGIRFNKDIELLPGFSKYLFRSTFLRKQIIKTANGVTRFNISKERFKKIIIPIPPSLRSA
jgi:type I restriction enzyme S subunit